MLDTYLTQALQDYLATPAAERDVAAGAELLLRLNRNRILYNNILRNPERLADKLEYELKKHLQIRLDGLTLQEVSEMNQKVIPAAAATLAAGEPGKTAPNGGKPHALYHGKRPDHDQLPEEIRAIYDQGGELYQRIRDTYNTLMQMADAEPCDRYEYLKILGDLDRRYREGWERYDHYTAPEVPTEAKQPETTAEASAEAKPKAEAKQPKAPVETKQTKAKDQQEAAPSTAP